MITFIKDPQGVLDYGFDWNDSDNGGPWLETGDTITTSTWKVPTGITKDSDSNTDTTTTIWLSGGTVGATYKITNRIVTVDGRTTDRSFYVKVQNK